MLLIGTITGGPIGRKVISVTTQIWVVTHHQYGISVLISQMSVGEETSGSVAKCRLFSKAMAGMTAKETCTLIIVITPGINNSIIIMNK